MSMHPRITFGVFSRKRLSCWAACLRIRWRRQIAQSDDDLLEIDRYEIIKLAKVERDPRQRSL
jgi:hypothetical protein